jgi:hypothetical protein
VLPAAKSATVDGRATAVVEGRLQCCPCWWSVCAVVSVVADPWSAVSWWADSVVGAAGPGSGRDDLGSGIHRVVAEGG